VVQEGRRRPGWGTRREARKGYRRDVAKRGTGSKSLAGGTGWEKLGLGTEREKFRRGTGTLGREEA